jgi:hypothetical protein
MNDNIQEYLERGETEYLGKADSVMAIGGKERILITWIVNKDPRIESCVIYWNDKADSATFPVDRSKITDDRMSVYLNIPEGAYLFNLYHRGSKGYRSIVSEVSGKVYGGNYQASLGTRKTVDMMCYPDSVEINWAPASESMVKTVFTYEQSSGNTVDVTVLSEDTKIVIRDYKHGGRYSSKTYYIPEPGALDTFEIVSQEQFSEYYWLNKSEWIPYALATHNSDGDGIACLLDGNYSSFWHSPYSGGYDITTNPLYVGFDMLSEKQIKAIKLEKRYDTRIAEIRVSLDNNNWTTVGSIVIDNSSEHGTGTLTFNPAVNARYVRLYNAKSGNADGRGSIFEIDVEGADVETSTLPAVFRYDRSNWSVVNVSSGATSAEGGDGKNALFDNNLTTCWYSKSVDGYAPAPHWAVFDLGSEKDIAKIVAYRRRKNTDTKTVQYFIGTDPAYDAASWQPIGEIEFPAQTGSNSGGEILTLDIPESVNTRQGRYLKLYLPDSNNSNEGVSLAEIYLYGKIR